MIDLSIVIPAYNEEAIIRTTIFEVDKVLSELLIQYEIIVVNDGSSDSTLQIVTDLGKENKKIKIVNQQNQGKGQALKNGTLVTKGALVAFFDADMDILPENLLIFLKIMSESHADLVIGSKRHPNSIINYPLNRKILSSLYQVLNKCFFNLNVMDTQVGIKLIKRKVLQRTIPLLLVKKFAFDLELLIVSQHYGYSILEAPIELNYQNFPSSVNLKSILYILKDTMEIFYRLRIVRWYDREWKIR